MKYTKSWGNVLVAAREHHDVLVESGDINEQELRYVLSKAARKEEARRLVNDAGLSLREAAKELGVSKDTIANDLSNNSTEHVDKLDSQLVQQSTSNEHYTPVKYIEAARSVLGSFDLDPASCARANEVVGAASFFEFDGLTQEWRGNIWLNPPYGGDAGKFIIKLCREYEIGNVKSAVTLVNAHCTDTSWFQHLWDYTICFTDHRINFYGDEKRSGSTHGSAFAYLGKSPDVFSKVFRRFGAVVRRYDNQ